MRLLLALLLCVPLAAQEVTIQFSPQGTWGGFKIHLVSICNQKADAQSFHSGLVRNEAARQGLAPAGFALVERQLGKRNRMSAPRIMLSVAEVGGWVLSALVAGDAIWKPAAPWQRTLPVVGAGAIRFATTITARHSPEEELPSDLLPVFVSVPAGKGACVEYTMPAVPR